MEYGVFIDGKRYSAKFATAPEYANSWQSVLKKAYQRSEVKCACAGRGQKRLAIKCYATGKFGLARYPESGEEHANDCEYFALHPEKSGLKIYEGVITEGADGSLGVKLSMGLKIAQCGKEENHERPTKPGTGKHKQTMSLTGLIHLLWEQAGLNRWWPKMEGKRRAWLVNRLLQEAAEKIVSNGQRLNTCLITPAASATDAECQKIDRKCRAAIAQQRRLIVIGSLARHSSDLERKMESCLRLYPFFGLPMLFMNEKKLWRDTAERFPYAMAGWRNRHRVIAIAQIEARLANTTTGEVVRGKVVALSLILVNEQWIPVESGLERIIADLLVEEKRAFIKPLRYDADAEEVFPDFVLLDTNSPNGTPMEVFGRDDEAYRQRMAEKTTYYNKHFGATGWWKWVGGEKVAIPPFPLKQKGVTIQCDSK